MTTSSTDPVTTTAAAAPDPTTTTPGRDWFPLLDTLRAVGAIAVMTTHVAFLTGSYGGQGYDGWLLARLDVGVALFFVLSGFLLSRPYLATAVAGRPAPSLARYARRRVWRVLPLAVVTVALALVLLESNRGASWYDRLSALTLTSTYLRPSFPAGLTHLWSLATEITFYAVLPALMALLVGRRRRTLRVGRVVLLVAGSFALAAVWFAVAVPALEGVGVPSTWLPGYLAWFAVGIGLAAAREAATSGADGRLLASLRTLALQPGVCWTLAGGLLLLASTPIAGPATLAPVAPEQHVVKVVLYAVAAGLVVLTGVFPTTPRYAAALGHAAPRRLGAISYAVFCLHLPIIHLVFFATGWEFFEGRFLAVWVLTAGLTWVASEAAYRWIEVPAQRIGHGRPVR
ncbi:acyltransferase family protein [Nocardioides sp. CPCC 205120]|uniref:acyltransferase family protein n=1 Tax=Nocardioides sp. CPCC 205120 TaxID=3406462 RepID=UPI003B509909